MEVCPETELIAIEDPATVCDGSLEIGEGREAQMICYMRHGSSPRLMAPQPILDLNRPESPCDPFSRRPYDTVSTSGPVPKKGATA